MINKREVETCLLQLQPPSALLLMSGWSAVTRSASADTGDALFPLQLNNLQTENTSLRWQTPSGQPPLQGPPSRQAPRGGRAMSMYETGSSLRQYPHRADAGRREDGVVLQPFPANVSLEPCNPGGRRKSWMRRRRRMRGGGGGGAWLEAGVGFSLWHL